MERKYYVYILASKQNGALYIGMTGNLGRRIFEHKEGLADGFTRKYSVHRLVWYEGFDDPNEARLNERRLKKWNRKWKINLIEKTNPTWEDLSSQIIG